MKITTQFVKYVTVAGLAAASDWMVFTFLMAALGVPIAAQANSRIVGGLVSFTTNKFWSFESLRADRTPIEARRFMVLFAISYLLSLLLFSTLGFTRLGAYWAKLLADTLCFIFNFFVMRFWVYRPEREPGREASAGGLPVSTPSDRTVLRQPRAEPDGTGQYQGATSPPADAHQF